MSALTGQSLGRYTILEQLGEGGMATVYKAYDTRLERDVAVKIIRTELFGQAVLERMLKRFEREAKALSKLTHPNIVGVMDYGEQEGRPYLVMEYLPGGTLKQALGKPFAWQEALKLLLPVAEALDFAHSQGIIHRDVKPSNILLTQRRQPMLTDFGIAKLLESEETATLTGTGVGVGTPEYMAPEQVDARTADQRADIYSLGIVLYEMVTGRKPYRADTPMAVMIMQARDPLPRPGQFVRGLPDGVEKVLLKALAKRPEDRYQRMGEFAAAMESLLTGAPAVEKSGQRAQVSSSPAIQRPASAPASTLSTRLENAPAPSRPPQSAIENRKSPIQRWPPWAVGLGGFGGLLALGLILALIFGRQSGLFQPRPTSTPLPTHTPQATSTPRATSTPTATFTPAPTSTPALGIGSTWVRPADGMTMLYVPAGEFEMGSEDGYADERPVHTIFLDAYWIDETEVTNAMYEKCVAAGICKPPVSSRSKNREYYYGSTQYAEYPVIFINWNSANTYCEWAQGRLPSEAEWEKAARGTNGLKYPWGSETPNCSLNNSDNCVGNTATVGNYPSGKSPYGLYDMAGNVWEWVADWYDSGYYANSPSRNPTGPPSGKYRVLRGGSWGDYEYNVRTAYRLRSVPSTTSYYLGFRCSRSP